MPPPNPTQAENQKKLPSNLHKVMWPFVVVISFFLFRNQIGTLIANAKEVTVLGVTIKAKGDIDELINKVQEFKDTIQLLKTDVQEYGTEITTLIDANDVLEKKLASCTNIRPNPTLPSNKYNNIKKLNKEVNTKLNYLDKLSIIKYPNSK